jgi:hypothetical protein
MCHNGATLNLKEDAMTRRTTQSNKTSNRHWQAHVKAFAQIGFSRAEYCRHHNLSYYAMIYWQRKLSRSSSNSLTLVPVALQVPEKNNSVSARAELQLILPGKATIAVGDNFSPATLNRLLSVLENRHVFSK